MPLLTWGIKSSSRNTVFKIYEGQTQIILTAIVNALILLPFILLISPAGYCSDKYRKLGNTHQRLGRRAGLIVHYPVLLFWAGFGRLLMTFMLALQSAFYFPLQIRLYQGNGGQK